MKYRARLGGFLPPRAPDFSPRGWWVAALAALVVILAMLGVACGDAVVGGACADGFEPCRGACVAAGACDRSNGAGRADAATDAGDPADGAPPTDGGVSDTQGAGGGTQIEEGGLGGILFEAGRPRDAGAGLGADGGGALGDGGACTKPLTACGGECLDTDTDPNNCGACGRICPSGICSGGTCRGARSGHIVAIGHDYTAVSPGSSAARVLSNAIFLPTGSPVRVLAFDAYADAIAIDRVAKLLDAEAAASGRTYTRTSASTTPALVDKLRLESFDVALFYDQPTAPAGTLATMGVELQAKLAAFTLVGGVVVVLDGGAGTGEMPSFLTSAGLLDTRGHTATTGKTLDVLAPGDAVGLEVLSPYLAPTRTVRFTTSEAPSSTASVVVEEPVSRAPVVVHKVVRKP